MDKVRHYLIGVIAGRRFAYWISDKVSSRIENLHSVAGGGAAIVLVNVARNGGWEMVEFSLDGWSVTIKKESIL